MIMIKESLDNKKKKKKKKRKRKGKKERERKKEKGNGKIASAHNHLEQLNTLAQTVTGIRILTLQRSKVLQGF